MVKKISTSSSNDGEHNELSKDGINMVVESSKSTTRKSNSSSSCERGSVVPAEDDPDIKASKLSTSSSTPKTLCEIEEQTVNVKIHVPGISHAVQVQMVSSQLIQEIIQILLDREETCHRTCFSIRLNNVMLDNFSEIKAIENFSENLSLDLVEEPYTPREARAHVCHINDLLQSSINFIQETYNGLNGSSPSFVSEFYDGEELTKIKSAPIPDYILPNSSVNFPLTPLHPINFQTKSVPVLKSLAFSGWNPPPSYRRLLGDLLYVEITTIDDRQYQVTACPQGFYVNQSTKEVFDPRPVSQRQIYHSLVDLLSNLSPVFRKRWNALQHSRCSKNPLLRLPTPVPVFSWLSPVFPHSFDPIRGNSNEISFNEVTSPIAHNRDWNEELQITRDLPQNTPLERLVRDRTMFRVHSDFVSAAARSALGAVDGHIPPINPGDEKHVHMFIWNSMFLSLGFDVRDHYADFGGDAAAFAAARNDLKGIGMIQETNTTLRTVGTVLVDYQGYRVSVQSIIPGILEKEQEQSVIYGSTNFGISFVDDESYRTLLSPIAETFHLKAHEIKISSGESITLSVPVELKGIVGNDKRKYILDLIRMCPPDLNYCDCDVVFEDNLKKECYPIKSYKHRFCCVRPELLSFYVENKYSEFLSYVANALKKSGFENEAYAICSETKSDQINKIISDPRFESIVREACTIVGSEKLNEFTIAFNPNLYQPHVKLMDSTNDDVAKLADLCASIVTKQIPLLVKHISECGMHLLIPLDGACLVEAMHARGINVRYLGSVARGFLDYDPTLFYMYTIAVSEIVVRSAKHLFRKFLTSVPSNQIAAACTHFLNCFFSLECNKPTNELKKKSRRGSKRTYSSIPAWKSISSNSLWVDIVADASNSFNFDLKEIRSFRDVVTLFNIRPIPILRRFCIVVGIQLCLKNYDLDNSNFCFGETDVVGLFPVISFVPSNTFTDGHRLLSAAESKICDGNWKDGFDLVTESHNLLSAVYGPLHNDVAMCLRLLARLNYVLGECHESCVLQQKVTIITERLYGLDNPTVIQDYCTLAHYCFAAESVDVALRLLYRARYLTLLCCSTDHPRLVLIDSNIALMLQASNNYAMALRFAENALKQSLKVFGRRSLRTAITYHILARIRSCKGEFREALSSEKEAYQIYREQLGKEHERTKESEAVLKHLTEQAVILQRKLNEWGRRGTVADDKPSIYVHQPSLFSVLNLLNILNGVVFVHLKEQDLFLIREILRYQQNDSSDLSSVGESSCEKTSQSSVLPVSTIISA